MNAPVRLTCRDCGAVFYADSPLARLCDACKAEHLRRARRNQQRKERGWTPEEIALGHRIDEKRKGKARLDPRTPPIKTPVALRPEGPFEFIERVDRKHWRVRCKLCGREIVRSVSMMYMDVKSCGCRKERAPRGSVKKPRPVPEHAVPHTCITCGKAFMAGYTAKYCTECLDVRKLASARYRWRKRTSEGNADPSAKRSTKKESTGERLDRFRTVFRYGEKTRMTYREVCNCLGFSPESGYVIITNHFSVDCSDIDPDRVRALFVSCIDHGFRPSKKLADRVVF